MHNWKDINLSDIKAYLKERQDIRRRLSDDNRDFW